MKKLKIKFANLVPNDKLNHFFYGSSGFWALGMLFNIWMDLLSALIVSLTLVLLVAIANEAYFWIYDDAKFSVKDIVFTILPGVLTIILLTLQINLLLTH